MNNTKLKISIKNKLRLETYKLIHKDILLILKEDNNFKYTTNNNGIFFDISKLNNDTINNLNNLLSSVKVEEQNEKLTYKSYFIENYKN